MKDSTGLIVPSNGLDVTGVAKWNHTSTMYSVSVDEAQVLTGTTATNLNNALISNLKVTPSAAYTGSAYTGGGTDYSENDTNGTVTRVNGGAITSGATVYCTYTYQIPAANLISVQGQNFWNNNDEVSMANGRVTVITDATILFTSQYDTSVTFSTSGSGSDLYAAGATTAAKAGLFTNSNANSQQYVGRCLQVPTATDPYLGVFLARTPVKY